MLESSHLCHKTSQIGWTLSSFASAIFCQFLIKGLSFIFFQFLNKCIFHLSKETSIKLIPFGSFQITLFQNCTFSKNVNVTADVKIPAAHYFTLILFFTWVYFLNVVFGILDNNFMWLAVKSIYNRNLISLSVFNPPGFKSETFDIIYSPKNWFSS